MAETSENSNELIELDTPLIVLKNTNSNLGSQDDTDSSSVTISAPPKKRKPGTSSRKPQKYRKAWEFYPEFHPWLESVESNVYKARCKVCNKVLVADISVLQAHAQSIKHLKQLKASSEDTEVLESLRSPAGRASEPPNRKLFKTNQTPLVRKEKSKEPEDKSDDLSFAALRISGSNFS